MNIRQESYGETEESSDQPGLVQGVRDLRAFLSPEGAGAGRVRQGGGGEAAGLRLLQALRTAVP